MSVPTFVNVAAADAEPVYVVAEMVTHVTTDSMYDDSPWRRLVFRVIVHLVGGGQVVARSVYASLLFEPPFAGGLWPTGLLSEVGMEWWRACVRDVDDRNDEHRRRWFDVHRREILARLGMETT